MNYVILAAGLGNRLHPLTRNYPKCLYKLDGELTVVQMMVNNIHQFDSTASICVVTGFMKSLLEKSIKNVQFINNPFFRCTNSVASLWFARDLLTDDVTIINADIVVSKALIQDTVTVKFNYPFVLVDSSIKADGDYNVQIISDKVVVMSKELTSYYGEYAGITKLDPKSAGSLREEVIRIIEGGSYDQWYEDALVQLIFNNNFQLFYKDISEYSWTEVDCVDDLQKAKEIHAIEIRDN